MKFARWLTPLGSLVLLGSSIFHASGYMWLVHQIESEAKLPPGIEGVLKASWLLFSVEMFFLAVMAFLARNMERGGRVVLLCGACTGLSALLLLRFVGAFIGVYLLAAVTLLLVLGGTLQAKDPA